jgi:transcriptional regulator with XRE-family HTH domain
LADLGNRLRLARLRRDLPAAAVAASAGISRMTLHRAEHGEPAITAGTLARILGVLGLAGDLALLAREDPLGRQMQDARLPARRAAKTVASPAAPLARPVAAPAGLATAASAKPAPRIRLARYPQLKAIAWHLSPAVTTLAPEEAFALYERHWRHVDAAAMGAAERALLARLTATVGKGVLLV